MAALACQHHPEEAAVGICMRCRAPLCDACRTKLDGVNHCQSCLLAQVEIDSRAGEVEPAANGPRAWLSLALGLALLSGLTWTTLQALMPDGAP